MSNDIPLKFYDIVDEYEIDEEAQREMAREAAINEDRIDDIANFLNQWGNE